MAQRSNKAHPVNDGDWICSDKEWVLSLCNSHCPFLCAQCLISPAVQISTLPGVPVATSVAKVNTYGQHLQFCLYLHFVPLPDR